MHYVCPRYTEALTHTGTTESSRKFILAVLIIFKKKKMLVSMLYC